MAAMTSRKNFLIVMFGLIFFLPDALRMNRTDALKALSNYREEAEAQLRDALSRMNHTEALNALNHYHTQAKSQLRDILKMNRTEALELLNQYGQQAETQIRDLIGMNHTEGESIFLSVHPSLCCLNSVPWRGDNEEVRMISWLTAPKVGKRSRYQSPRKKAPGEIPTRKRNREQLPALLRNLEI
ncbi:uncharacterized protein [Montipora capricornis]|uniref:uncharacterized protein isoform X1 n=1 Tax=Montipora capricornis TaxID=246305 RepID=UPI0035F1D1FC